MKFFVLDMIKRKKCIYASCYHWWFNLYSLLAKIFYHINKINKIDIIIDKILKTIPNKNYYAKQYQIIRILSCLTSLSINQDTKTNLWKRKFESNLKLKKKHLHLLSCPCNVCDVLFDGVFSSMVGVFARKHQKSFFTKNIIL